MLTATDVRTSNAANIISYNTITLHIVMCIVMVI